MHTLFLYTRYAFRSFLRGKSRSVFGAFCIAVGITAVVALGLTGGNFRNAVTGDARKINRGDVSASPAGFGFTLKQYRVFQQLKDRGEITGYTSTLQDGNVVRSTKNTSLSAVGDLVAVDSKVYPYYDTITADEPAGVPISKLLASPTAAVVGHDVVDSLHLKIGDSITVNTQHGFSHRYTLVGIVPDSAPNPGFGAGFWNDFVMIDKASVLPFFHGLDVGANVVDMTTRNAAQAAKVKTELQRELGGFPEIKTVADVASDSKNGADGFDKFFKIMGLVAVVIGGIGIINTTLVAARRRTREIAVLKSLGMKGRQVILVFSIESLMLAIAGTAIGILGGIAASWLVNGVTQNLAGFSIPWSLQLEPIVAGILVGIVATVLFSYLPIVSASRLRPIVALRGDAASVVKTHRIKAFFNNMRHHPLRTVAGVRYAPVAFIRLRKSPRVRSVLLTLLLAGVMGTLAALYGGLASGADAITFGFKIGIGLLIGALVLTQLFVVAVWIVSKMPTFGRLSLRMAFRSMNTQKRRLASTLLALCIGMLSVGSVAIVAQNFKSVISESITHKLQIKALASSKQDPAIIAQLRREAQRLPGVTGYSFGAYAASADLISIDGRDANVLLRHAIATKGIDRDTVDNLASSFRSLEGRDLRVAGYAMTMKQGRNLGRADVGTNHIVMDDVLADTLGVKIGSDVAFRDAGRTTHFKVVGLYDDQSSFMLMANNGVDLTFMQQHGLTSPSPSHQSLFYLDTTDSAAAGDIASLRRDVPGVLVLDPANFQAAFTKALDKLTLFPEVIAALSLLAGVIIIANTVALAMIERRREFGVMKAVGARRRTILKFLFVENAIVGLLGAGAGVLLAMVATAVVDRAMLNITPSFDPTTVFSLLVLGMLLAVGASALSATPASTEKPMAVLRHE